MVDAVHPTIRALDEVPVAARLSQCCLPIRNWLRHGEERIVPFLASFEGVSP